ncbi:MarR family winged helix-turn-helix transcriptional regulator [Anaerobaca lacustris]|uniref:MarR family transcriptional regulator n=1 Tax=Anaerobaca lacustris TaxID=3044600 RepID=A0AAW6TYY2_9BACT|nr:MarR family transcriptional regulator [Sedimentisphaerales bacterium M17dextr]
MSRRFFELILAIKRKCQCNEEQIRKELGLTAAQLGALIVLDDRTEVAGCEFARRMGLSASRGSRVLNSLVAAGYVATHVRAEDRRTIQVTLTDKGRRMKGRIADRMTDCESRICDRLDHSDLRQVRAALERLEAVL